MIELMDAGLRFSFPDLDADASCEVIPQRTLRIPDDGRSYPLPPGLGTFPLRHVDDFAERVSAAWLRRGGVMFPMYQSEALWLRFHGWYPFAIRVAAGKVNALTGEPWSESLTADPQDYLVAPDQPWLDGYSVEKGYVRQFVAMPLGAGYTAEEQITGEAEHGGLQILAYPMKVEVWKRTAALRRRSLEWAVADLAVKSPDMGLAPGGRMRQEVYEDPYGLDAWDTRYVSRCFLHIANSLVWSSIAGHPPPHPPPTAEEYSRHGLPWFEYYGGDRRALDGGSSLSGLKSVRELGAQWGEVPLPENASAEPRKVVELRAGLTANQVREGPV